MNRPRNTKDGLPINVRKHNGSYVYRWTEVVDEKRLWRIKKLCRIDAGLEAMYQALAKFHGIAPAIKIPNMPQRINDYRKEYFPTLTTSVQREYGRMFDKLGKAFDEFDVDQVKKPHIIQFIKTNFPDKSRMASEYRNRLVSFFAWSVEQGDIEHSPAAGIKLKHKPPRDRYINDDEYKRIREALLIGVNGRPTPSGPMVQAYFDLCFLTMQRTTDIRLLQWNQIAGGLIRFKPSKTAKSSGRQVDIPITQSIKTALESARAARTIKDMHYVIHQGNGKPYTASGLRQAITRACKRAGVADASAKDLRPKSVTDAMKSGHTLEQLQSTLAHTNKATTEKYLRQHSVPVSAVVTELPQPIVKSDS